MLRWPLSTSSSEDDSSYDSPDLRSPHSNMSKAGRDKEIEDDHREDMDISEAEDNEAQTDSSLSGQNNEERWSIFKTGRKYYRGKILSIPRDEYCLTLEKYMDHLQEKMKNDAMPLHVMEDFMDFGSKLFSTWEGLQTISNKRTTSSTDTERSVRQRLADSNPKARRHSERLLQSLNQDSDFSRARGGLCPKENNPSLPEFLETKLKSIEQTAKHDSKILLGKVDDIFSQVFSKPFTPPVIEDMEDGLWPVLDGELNSVIGVDVCGKNIRRGRFGVDGLLRTWLYEGRKWRLWDSDIDKLILPKLETILNVLQAGLLNPQSSLNRAQSTLQGTSSAQSSSKVLDPPRPSSASAPSSPQASPLAQSRDASPAAFSKEAANQPAMSSTSQRKSTASIGSALASTSKGLAKISGKTGSHLNSSDNEIPDIYGSVGKALEVSSDVTNRNSSSETPNSNNNQENLTIWKGSVNPPINIQLLPTSMCKSCLENSDCGLLLSACLRLLAKREKGAEGILYDPEMRLPDGTQFTPKSRLGLRKWLAQKPSQLIFYTKNSLLSRTEKAGFILLLDDTLFQPGSEAPWHRSDILNLDLLVNSKKTTHPEPQATKYLSDMLIVFNNPSSTDIERGLRFVLSAIAFVGVERNPLLEVPELPEVKFLSQDIKISLSCALHYQQLQALNAMEITTQDVQSHCVKRMAEIVDSVYGMIQALATIQAKFRYHLQFCNNENSEINDNAMLEFEDVGKVVDIKNINAEALAPLAAFLCSGVKGLLIYPRHSPKLTQIRLALFIVLSDVLNDKVQIEEPIWKKTQTLILKWIRDVMFPEGFKMELEVGESCRHNQPWKHKDLAKFDLANALQLDLANFCLSRDKFLDGDSDSYDCLPFEIPDSSANVPKRSSHKK